MNEDQFATSEPNLTESERLQSLLSSYRAAKNTPVDVDAALSAMGAQQQFKQEDTVPQEIPMSVGQPAPLDSASASAIQPQVSATKNIELTAQNAAPVDKQYKDDALLAAQKQAREDEGLAMMAKSGSIIGTALAGQGHITPDKNIMELYDQYTKMAGQPVSDLLTQRQQQDEAIKRQMNLAALATEKEKSDPNSQVSQLYRNLAKGYSQATGLNIPLNAAVSASQIEKVLPGIEKYSAMLQSKEMMQDSKKTAAEQKKEIQDNKDMDKISKLLTAEIASGRSAFGVAARNKQAAMGAEALLGGGSIDPDSLDSRQLYELNRVLDRVLSQGQVTASSAAKLTPKTAKMDFAKLSEYLTGVRQGANAGTFVQSAMKTLQREKDIANQQIQATQQQLLGPYKRLKDNPGMQDTLRAAGIDPETAWDYSKKNTTQQNSNTLVTKDALKTYADKHNTTTKEAADFLRRQGYIVNE